MQQLHVHTTKDYGLFKSVDGNRSINELHRNRLKKSMQEKQLVNPIIVNDKHEIIDGQHRFSVCQELGLPVHYLIVPGYGLNEVHRMNRISKNWTIADFLTGYADMEIKEYTLFKDYFDRYTFPLSTALSVAINRAVNQDDLNDFMAMNFKFEDYAGAIDRADKITSLKNLTDLYNKRCFVYAILRLLKNARFDFHHFYQKLAYQRGSLLPCNNVDEYIRKIEEIYNFKSREKVSLRY